MTDLTYLKEIAQGDTSFIKKMVILFINKTPEEIGNLEKYNAGKNWKLLNGVAHKMKPSFTFVGLQNLTGILNCIEEYSENENHLDLIPGLIANLKESCLLAILELELYNTNL